MKERLSGNEAVAVAMKQVHPDVVAAFPITPSTEICQYYSQYVADGSVQTEFVAVESEHSAMSACIGSQAAGARTMTATSANGLALMWEMLYIAASTRLPIVMSCVNRALSGPININNDHSDSMGARDSGWIQLYSENCQEAYDNLIQAVRIAEDPRVMLPVMVCQDGFITSHAVENLDLLPDEKVKEFVGESQPESWMLNARQPIAIGPYDSAQYYMEHKRQQAQGMVNAQEVIKEVGEAFEKQFGRGYGMFEGYRLDDAEVALVILSSSAGTAKEIVDRLREEGHPVGILKLRVFRPFPFDEIRKALAPVKRIAVMDKAEGFSAAGGPLVAEIRSCLYGLQNAPEVASYVYGLGGRDVTVEALEEVFMTLLEDRYEPNVNGTYRYLSIREQEGK